MYKVIFDFLNSTGEWKTDYLDNNGSGFTLADADHIAYQLKQQGCRNVKIEIM